MWYTYCYTKEEYYVNNIKGNNLGGGTTFSATPAVKLKPQIFIAKGSAPWYDSDDYWPDKDKVINTDESILGQATVTCNGVTDMSYMFGNCDNLTTLDLSSFNTSNVKDMSLMFNFCYSLTSLDLSNFDTSKVTTMEGMFSTCSSLTSLDLSNFDTSKVTTMEGMFDGCTSLTTIKGIIDMKSCEDCYCMFLNCFKLKGVKIKNPPADFENVSELSKSQYTIVS